MMLTPDELRYVARGRWGHAKTAGLVPAIQGQKCVDCDDWATEYDHRDYRRYMDVEPVCQLCNAKRGQGFPPTNSAPVEVWWYSENRSWRAVWFDFDEDDIAMLDLLAEHHGITAKDYIRASIRTEAKKSGIPV